MHTQIHLDVLKKFIWFIISICFVIFLSMSVRTILMFRVITAELFMTSDWFSDDRSHLLSHLCIQLNVFTIYAYNWVYLQFMYAS